MRRLPTIIRSPAGRARAGRRAAGAMATRRPVAWGRAVRGACALAASIGNSRRRARSLAVAAALIALSGAPAIAADAKPPADTSKPVTTVRVGGSPADAAFRDANQKAHARYRAAKADCRARPAAERSECLRAAKAELKTAQQAAKEAHDAAKRR
jgi:hypothetical protein